MRKNLILISIGMVFIILATILSKLIIGTSYIRLAPGQLDGIVSSALERGQGNTYLPLEGIDYSIGKIVYFNNSTWLIVPITSIKSSSTSLAVVHVVAGKDYLVLGPGSNFNNTQLGSLPSSVAGYLSK